MSQVKVILISYLNVRSVVLTTGPVDELPSLTKRLCSVYFVLCDKRQETKTKHGCLSTTPAHNALEPPAVSGRDEYRRTKKKNYLFS